MVKITQDNEAFYRYILSQTSNKWKCAECFEKYLDIKELEFESKVTARVVMGCCTARFEHTIVFDDYFPD
ncbi:hypothetical protein H7K06_06845 [Priestia aryabhattai]|uniref:hypothetical protein n=1 Tax=Priestia TaxID=2800373 RepID=UPI000BFDFA19|nr:hypothetical protein [Priestia aryabhattai]MBX9967234.1 hypothetical protein [Priestia aryabhattai]MCM3252433.1 hypothetical protein [Priestia aryabhattai]PHF65863.1 hypothetical protein COI42_23435 [Priestia aryabhattai]